MAFIDIFESDFSLPPRVCVLAPGPWGVPHYAEIPDDCAVIALNKAVMIPGVRIDVWLMNLFDQAWFEEANDTFDGVRVFWREEKTSVDYDPAVEARLLAIDNPVCYYFRVVRPGLHLLRKFAIPLEDLTRRGILDGGTVTGAAIQLAYHFGSREVLLCGADMCGDEYFDGSFSEQLGHGDVWSCTGDLNRLIRWLGETQGMTITSLSPTRLDVPRHRPALHEPTR